MWETYQRHYGAFNGSAQEWKSSPLADDHDLEGRPSRIHQSQVIDLTCSLPELWRGVRKSYRPLINRSLAKYQYEISKDLDVFHALHTAANGRETRSQGTWDCMAQWLVDGYGLLVMARLGDAWIDGAYFITYKGGAYYASAASPGDNKDAHKAVMWEGIKALRRCHITQLEMGAVSGDSQKEKGLAMFKTGFGGAAHTYEVVRR